MELKRQQNWILFQKHSFINKISFLTLAILIMTSLLSSSCTKDSVQSTNENLVFYEVYVPHWGNKNAVRNIMDQIPHFRQMFIDVIVLSPMNEMSARMKFGQISSPYAVKDFYAFNEDLGTEEEFKLLIDSLHKTGIKVVMDWFPAVAAYDNALAQFRDSTEAREVLTNRQNLSFNDAALLDYSNDDVGEKMIDAMQQWQSKYKLDGARIHYGDALPTTFLDDLSDELDGLLIAGEDCSKTSEYFDFSPNYELYDAMIAAIKEQNVSGIQSIMANSGEDQSNKLNFSSNYFLHSQDGSANIVFGNGYKMAFALTSLLNGQIFLHGGQEIPLLRGASIYQDFDITWPKQKDMDFYRQLILLKNKNKALSAGQQCEIRFIETGHPKVIAMEKKYKAHTIIAIFNFSGKSEVVQFKESIFNVNDYQANRPIQIRADEDLKLAPMYFLLFTNV